MTSTTDTSAPTWTSPAMWAALAAPLPADAIQWRQDGRAALRGAHYVARFVAFIDAQFVRARLDEVVPGEWELSLSVLDVHPDEDDVAEREYSIKACLSVHGVHRECIGSGRDYKTAATDAFKRAAVRFGIGAELYEYDQNWVQVDGDGKFARPLEDPGVAYERRRASGSANGNGNGRSGGSGASGGGAVAAALPAAATAASSAGVNPPAPSQPSRPGPFPSCPKCGGHMWDNRASKRNPKAPDFKCRAAGCDGVVWSYIDVAATNTQLDRLRQNAARVSDAEFPPALVDNEMDDLPF